MNFSTMKLDGWKKEDPHPSDNHFDRARETFERLAGSSTGTFIIPEYTPISNQGQLSSCVGNSTTDALEILLGIQSQNSVVQLSRLMTYWIARRLTHDEKQDAGTFIRSAFSQLARLGVCPEVVWPYDESKVCVQPSLKAFEDGDSNRISNYYRISSSGSSRLNDLETAIRAKHPVVFGTTVGSNFMDYDGTGVLDIPNDSLGGHAIICVGVRPSVEAGKREFLIRNSWGTEWGYKGHAWLTEDYMAWSATNDLWVPTLIPALKF